MLAKRLSFCSFGFGCNDPTYHPSSVRLFIILVFFFFPVRWLGIAFVLSLGVPPPLITPVTWLSLFCVCIFFGFDYYYYYYYIFSLSLFVCLFVLFLLILFLGKLVFITSEIVHPSPLVRSRFTVCFSTFNGNKLPLMTLVDLYRGGPVCFQSNCQSGNLIFEVYISFVSNVLYSIFAFKQCEKAKGLGNKTLVLSLGVTSPPVTPVTELDLSLFLPDCVIV